MLQELNRRERKTEWGSIGGCREISVLTGNGHYFCQLYFGEDWVRTQIIENPYDPAGAFPIFKV